MICCPSLISLLLPKAKRKMGRVLQLASFSLAEVTYATGANSIAYLVQEQARSASFRVKARSDNVSGVILPAFESDRSQGTGTFRLFPFCLVQAIVKLQLGALQKRRALSRFQPNRAGSGWPANP